MRIVSNLDCGQNNRGGRTHETLREACWVGYHRITGRERSTSRAARRDHFGRMVSMDLRDTSEAMMGKAKESASATGEQHALCTLARWVAL